MQLPLNLPKHVCPYAEKLADPFQMVRRMEGAECQCCSQRNSQFPMPWSFCRIQPRQDLEEFFFPRLSSSQSTSVTDFHGNKIPTLWAFLQCFKDRRYMQSEPNYTLNFMLENKRGSWIAGFLPAHKCREFRYSRASSKKPAHAQTSGY